MEKHDMPLVSIVIPVYNGSDYLAEAIDSALAQTYQNVEILVVNDGSDDHGATREIALSYGDRIRYFEKENGGVSTALNLGIREMRGEYFSWLSHDDLYHPEKIRAEIDEVRSFGKEDIAVYSDYDLLQMPERKTVRQGSFEKRFGKVLVHQGCAPILFSLFGGCTLLIPRSYFERYGMFDPALRMVQDYDLFFRFFSGKDILFVNRSLVKSRVHDHQQGIYGRKRVLDEGNSFFCKLLNAVRSRKIFLQGAVRYVILGIVTSFSWKMGYLDAEKLGKDTLRRLSEPIDTGIRNHNFIAWISDDFTKKICLYCAGKRGKWLKYILEKHGVKVTFFSDSNPEKWGQRIEGTLCISPDDLDRKRYLLIVTKNDPDDLVDELKKKGFSRVISFDEIEKELLFLPMPKRYL